MIRAVSYAEGLQAMALDHIRDVFGTAEAFDITGNVSYGDFIKALTEAEEAGTRDEFEAMLGRQMADMMNQQAAAAQQQPQGQVQ